MLIKFDFKTRKSIVFSHEHFDFGFCVMLNEKKNLVMSGGNDERVVCYDLDTGYVKKVFNLGIGRIFYLLNIRGITFVYGSKNVKFINQINMKSIETNEITANCSTVNCMSWEIKNSFDIFLYMGGSYSSKLSRLKIPKEICALSKFSKWF